MRSMKLISTFFLVTLIQVQVQAADIDADTETLYDTTYPAAGIVGGCDVRQSLVMTEGVNLQWNTSTICNGEQVAQDTTVFAKPAIETLVYLLGKAEDVAAEANSQGVSADQVLFVWDGRIFVKVRSVGGKHVVELSNTSLSGDQVTPLWLALSGTASDSTTAMTLGRTIYSSMVAFSH
jgi:hypothetical protein